MHGLRRSDISYSNLTMSNDGNLTIQNILSEFTGDTAVSTANTTTISFDVAQLTDVDLYNVGSIDASGNKKTLVAGSVTLKDKATGSTIKSEDIDFYTATSIAYASTNNLLYHKNIRAFHGGEIYQTDGSNPQGYTIEVYLEADTNDFVEIGIIACGVFVQYGRTRKGTPSKEQLSLNVMALESEYNNLLYNSNDETEFFVHSNMNKFNSENLYMAYGIPKIGSGSENKDPSKIDYKIEFKV